MKFEKVNLSEKFDKLPAGDYAVGLIAKMTSGTESWRYTLER